MLINQINILLVLTYNEPIIELTKYFEIFKCLLWQIIFSLLLLLFLLLYLLTAWMLLLLLLYFSLQQALPICFFVALLPFLFLFISLLSQYLHHWAINIRLFDLNLLIINIWSWSMLPNCMFLLIYFSLFYNFIWITLLGCY
jgi:hypothetical protein